MLDASTCAASLLRYFYRFPTSAKPWRRAVDQGSYGPEARDIARSILTHLAQDPEAKDTVAGIAVGPSRSYGLLRGVIVPPEDSR